MASNLPGEQCVANYDVCLLRAGRLASTCGPLYQQNAGLVTDSIVSMTATPEIEEGTPVEQKNGCGDLVFSVNKPDILKSWTLAGVLAFADVEAMELLFGGSLILGATGGPFSTKAIGYAAPGKSAAQSNGVALEVVTKAGSGAGGACQVSGAGSDYPAFTGHIFPKALLTLGERNFQEGIITVAFTGKAEGNPNYGEGPFGDWSDTADGDFPEDSGYVQIGYDELPTTGLTVKCGYQNTAPFS
jgi:hypothetical protein